MTTRSERRLLKAAAKAAQLDCSTKTLDRLVAAERLKAPLIVNGRKFYDADDQPTADGTSAPDAV